ncbi:semaphorin-5A-like isoform X1 [Pomacea canaliculata]|uniref:semaphorin-5A-like isoform X1 n=1 Tax=Pomacea canaliculata TaxID=400727 RepID=UPI000D7389A0|nr:semaphorin-5A-like isoform X1 [Pomacea canaliculata]
MCGQRELKMALTAKFLQVVSLVLVWCCPQGLPGAMGHWAEWGATSMCSSSCDMGIQTRIRHWVYDNGTVSDFTNSEHATCFLLPCPKNGSWSDWGMFGECSVACGTGMRVRRRDCNSPPPMDGGLYCKGESEQEEECVQKPCPPQPKDFDMASCPQRNFTCENGLMCVAESERCDGTLHCSDGSDEVRCWRFRGGYRIGHVHYSHSGSSHSVYTVLTVFVAILSHGLLAAPH